MAEQKLTEEKFHEMMRGFQPVCVIYTGLDLGVFDKLAAADMDAAQAARALRCSRRGVEALLNALVATGTLDKKGEKFSLAPFSRKYLVPGTPAYIGSGAHHAGHIMRSWALLPEIVRSGKPAPRPPANTPESKKRHRHFILAMNDNARRYAGLLISKIDLRGVKNVIDVGGGPGTYAFAIAKAIPGSRVAIFDTPATCAIARERIMELGFQPQVGTIEGDFITDGLGTGFDFVLMSNILHIYSPSENKRLVKKGFSALEPGGRLVVVEFRLDPSRTTPETGAMFSINMLVNTETGSAYTTDEIKSWLKGAGFSKVEVIDLDGRSLAYVAHKSKKKKLKRIG